MRDNITLQEIEIYIEQKELKHNGYSIFYYTSGDTGKELIVFLHPAFADHRCFDKQIDYFAKDFRVVTIDMLGHGLSIVENAGHVANMDDPDTFNRIVMSFIKHNN